MNKFEITQLSNGWSLQGPRHLIKNDKACYNEDLRITVGIFLPTIQAVADVLLSWQVHGFVKATARAEEEYGVNKGGK